jgi:hypothetical protein
MDLKHNEIWVRYGCNKISTAHFESVFHRTTIFTTLLCAARLLVLNACVYTSSVILLFACRKSSWTVLTSSPFAFNKVPKEWRIPVQP